MTEWFVGSMRLSSVKTPLRPLSECVVLDERTTIRPKEIVLYDSYTLLSDTNMYSSDLRANRFAVRRFDPRLKSALATQNAGSTPWRAFALKTRDDGGQVVLPGPVDRGEGGPREGRVRPKPHRNRSSPRRHLGLDQGHGRLGESREREREDFSLSLERRTDR